MKTFEIEYDGICIATVQIETREAHQVIKEMVECWSGWQQRKKAAGGYLEAWLKQLGAYILRHGIAPPPDEEGWYPLDGTHGITVTDWQRWEVNEEEIFISEA